MQSLRRLYSSVLSYGARIILSQPKKLTVKSVSCTCLVLRQRARTLSVRTFMQFEITVHPRGQVLLQWLLLLHRQDVWRNGLHFNKCLHSFSTQLGDWFNFYHLNLTLNPKRVDSVVILLKERNFAGLLKFQNVWGVYMVITAISVHVLYIKYW